MMFALITGSAMVSAEDITGIWYCELMEQDGQVVDGATMASMGLSLPLKNVSGINVSIEFQDGTAVYKETDYDTETPRCPIRL